jgi:hypothetical protein
MSDSLKITVDLHGLTDKLRVLSDVEVKSAVRSGVSKIGTAGRTMARGMASKKTGIGAAGISKTTPRGGSTVTCTIYYGGAHAHIMRWQDEGTGRRHKRDGQYTGFLEPQRVMERTAMALEPLCEAIMEVEIEAAIVKSGLG